ncbi:DUF3558 domain-containing protein [Nocardia cyriacigeorgica]|uniref:DUF3558 domain-containing protein n=1 Tax=Nocardia cyriacigeorgica TaxID=135487 RepID=UPI0013B9E143|nr:DUF3558 domain-containing protein [Nocardia cyriacigeorgica]NEW49947.1 DUF3558 domain-containing protein [Nocardia cyriacigeorgica]
MVAAAGLLALGCGTTATTGAPTPAETAAATPEPLNVCKDLPDAALTAAGLDPSTELVITDPPSGPSSWRVCAWDPAGMSQVTYVVELYSTSYTLADSRNNEDMTDFTDAEIGGREGITFMEKSDTEKGRCRAAIAAEQGSFIVSTAWLETGEKPTDLCGLAVQYLSDLEPALPE